MWWQKDIYLLLEVKTLTGTQENEPGLGVLKSELYFCPFHRFLAVTKLFNLSENLLSTCIQRIISTLMSELEKMILRARQHIAVITK